MRPLPWPSVACLLLMQQCSTGRRSTMYVTTPARAANPPSLITSPKVGMAAGRQHSRGWMDVSVRGRGSRLCTRGPGGEGRLSTLFVLDVGSLVASTYCIRQRSVTTEELSPWAGSTRGRRRARIEWRTLPRQGCPFPAPATRRATSQRPLGVPKAGTQGPTVQRLASGGP